MTYLQAFCKQRVETFPVGVGDLGYPTPTGQVLYWNTLLTLLPGPARYCNFDPIAAGFIYPNVA